ncbi:hypothetical protein, partial [Rhodoferax sp.]|uniref:hypothetical protein n=1 Tax=Rhodoferax sp. TaxID=50421 RepID=UPI0025DF1938
GDMDCVTSFAMTGLFMESRAATWQPMIKRRRAETVDSFTGHNAFLTPQGVHHGIFQQDT